MREVIEPDDEARRIRTGKVAQDDREAGAGRDGRAFFDNLGSAMLVDFPSTSAVRLRRFAFGVGTESRWVWVDGDGSEVDEGWMILSVVDMIRPTWNAWSSASDNISSLV